MPKVKRRKKKQQRRFLLTETTLKKKEENPPRRTEAPALVVGKEIYLGGNNGWEKGGFY